MFVLVIALLVFASGCFLAGVHPALTAAVWGSGLAFGIYRVFADSRKVFVAWRSVADELGLAIEGGGSRMAAVLKPTEYAPRIHGTYRAVRVAVRGLETHAR